MLSSECGDDQKKQEHIKGTAVAMSKKTVSAVYVFSCFAHSAHCERLNTETSGGCGGGGGTAFFKANHLKLFLKCSSKKREQNKIR